MLSIVLLVLLCIFAAFVVSNLSEALPIVFLGVQTVPLPVGIWLLLFFVAGVAISLLVAMLLKLVAPMRSRSKQRDLDSRSSESQRSANDRFSKPPHQTQPSPPPRSQRPKPATSARSWQEPTRKQSPVGPTDEAFESPSYRPSYEAPYEADARSAYEELQAQDDRFREPASRQNPAPEIAEDFDLQPGERSAASTPRKSPRQQNSHPESNLESHPEEKKERWYDEEFFEDWEAEERVPTKATLENGDENIGNLEKTPATESESARPKIYEKKQELENQSWQGSIYAYTYRKSDRTPEPEAEDVGEKAISLGEESAGFANANPDPSDKSAEKASDRSTNQPADEFADEFTAESPSQTPASVSSTEPLEASSTRSVPPMTAEKWDEELFPDEEPDSDSRPTQQEAAVEDTDRRVVMPPLSPKKSSDRDRGGSDWERSDRKEDW